MSDENQPVFDSDDNPEIPELSNKLLEHPPVNSYQNINVFALAFIIEGGMAVLALCLAYVGFYDRSQPLNSLDWDAWKTGLIWGLLGTLPLLGYLAVFHFKPPSFFQPMKKFVQEEMQPIFRRSSLLELLIISLLAGFCEELFFRWCLQGGIASWMGSQEGAILALVVVSILFGICHWVNASYGITTAVVGAYLGLLMIWTGSFLAPAIAHALFDFVALVYVARMPSPSDVRD